MFHIIAIRCKDTCRICEWLIVTIFISEPGHDLFVFFCCKSQIFIAPFPFYFNILCCRSFISGLHILSMPFVFHRKSNQIIARIHCMSSLFIGRTLHILTRRKGCSMSWSACGLHSMGCRHNFLTNCNLHLSFLLKNQTMNFLCVWGRTHHQN